MDRQTIIDYIKETSNIRLISQVGILLSTSIYEFRCELFINDNYVPVRLLINDDFPRILPKFYLETYNCLGFIPHIEPDGGICYLERESVYVNEEEPAIVFDASVQLAKTTIEDGLNGKNHQDFREEFQVFWQRNTKISSLLLISFLEIGDKPKVVQIIKDNRYALVIDLNRDLRKQQKVFLKGNQILKKTGIFIPLSDGTEIIPPEYNKLWTAQEFVGWLKLNTTVAIWKLLQNDILSQRPERFEYIIFSIPRTKGPNLLAGVKFRPKKNVSNPLLEQEYEWKLSHLPVTRLDTKSILPRGGASMDLQSKKVLLIGCGSVGSQIAITLSKIGIGALDLVDFDKFKLENVNRFALGLEHISKQKSTALKDFINKNSFGISVNNYEGKISDLIKKNEVLINNYDLIISATGDPNVNFYLSRETQSKGLPLIIGWNEPYGIGGHALLSTGSKAGCYKCLYKTTHNSASFAAQEQTKPFHKHHLGCGEVYTPYSILDSINTSQLVVKLAKSYLQDKMKDPTILSWKGECEDFLSEGFELSARYKKQSLDDMYKNRSAFINPKCINCIN